MSDQRNPNAGDEDQVRKSVTKEKSRRDQELNDLREVLKTIHGRRVVWKILDHCKVFGSIWTASAQIHYYAGKQDVGHFVMAEVCAANEEAFLQMMKESYKGDL